MTLTALASEAAALWQGKPLRLLRNWLRVSSTCSTIAPSSVQRRPASFFSRAFTEAAKLGQRSASKRNSTAVETLLTFCPPGPEARMKLSESSQS